jgi:hypothetical protein
MKTRTIASTLMLLGVSALAAVTLVPGASAHYCEARDPDDCGPCTPPESHAHYVYVSDDVKVLWCRSGPMPPPSLVCETLARLGIIVDCPDS